MSYAKFRDAFAEALDQRYYPIEWLDKRVEEGRAVCIWTPKAAIVVDDKGDAVLADALPCQEFRQRSKRDVDADRAD